MQKIVAVIQARTGSTRLPGKVVKPILGEPMLARMLERVKRATTIGEVVVATSDSEDDTSVAELAEKHGVQVFRGSETDVLERFYHAAKRAHADVVVRLTGDCPLMDPAVIDEVVEHFIAANGALDYTHTPSNYPEGLDIEVLTFRALEESVQHAVLPSEREHVTLYVRNHPERYHCDTWTKGEEDYSAMHWSVDTPADLDFVTSIYKKLYPTHPGFTKDDVLALLHREPELLSLNQGGTGYEGLAKSLKEDEEFKKHHS